MNLEDLEARILADHIEGTKKDQHLKSAVDMFGTEGITPEMRRVAKAHNFRLMYGGGQFETR